MGTAETVVKRSYPGDLVWEYADVSWRFRSSFPGSIRWVAEMPTVDDFDDYLAAAVDPSLLLKLTAHILASQPAQDRSATLVEQVGQGVIDALSSEEIFHDTERFAAAQASWRKAQGHAKVLENLGTLMEQQQQAIEHNNKVLLKAQEGDTPIGDAEIVETVDVEVEGDGPFED